VDVYTTEDEQIEAIKKWWRENWKSLAGGILLGLGILYFGKSYIQSQDAKTGMAAFEFDAMMQSLNQDKKDQASTHAEILTGQYADTPFAVGSALALAKLKVEAGDLLAAESYLRWALDHAETSVLKHAARLRLARVLLANKKADDALKLLQGVDSANFTASYEQLKGDIQLAKGNTNEAITSYNLALAAMKPGDRGRNNLQMKLDDLGAAS
jgi:predicted negative regulator of RcsB-dependent stress response